MKDSSGKFAAVGHNTLIVLEEFAFGVNDQDLEVNRIEPSMVFAARVAKGDWVKESEQ